MPEVILIMCKKIFPLTVIFLLLLSLTFPTLVMGTAKATTAEIIVQQGDSIQEAINNASTGDTIRVKAGTYHEHIIINKSVDLIGENPRNTIIDGDGTGIVVQTASPNVGVINFTIRNGGSAPIDFGMFIISSGNTISNNILKDNPNGNIKLLKSNANVIVDNRIVNSNAIGIALSDNSNNNTVVGNTIANNAHGTLIDDSSFNTFYLNNFINNTNKPQLGTPTGIGNKFYNETRARGNYWTDYTGDDLNEDGIGDTPYPSEGSPWDEYPLMSPWGDTEPPVADAGPDQTVDEGITVTFNGTGSTDDVDIKSYVWTFTDVTPKNLTGLHPTYRFINVGNFSVTLNVTDYNDNWDTDTMWVKVVPEFSASIFYLLFIVFTLVAVTLRKRKRKKGIAES